MANVDSGLKGLSKQLLLFVFAAEDMVVLHFLQRRFRILAVVSPGGR